MDKITFKIIFDFSNCNSEHKIIFSDGTEKLIGGAQFSIEGLKEQFKWCRGGKTVKERRNATKALAEKKGTKNVF